MSSKNNSKKGKIKNDLLLKELVIDAVCELKYSTYPEHISMIVNKYNKRWLDACQDSKDYQNINLFTVSLQLAIQAARKS